MLMHSGYVCSLHLYQDQHSRGSLHCQLIPLLSGLFWNNSSITIFSLASMRWRLLTLTKLKQRNDETVVGFVHRFREVKNKCYSLNLGDKQLAELAFQGLLPTLREKYASHDLVSLSQLVSQMSQEGTFRRKCLMWITLIQKMKIIW
jgi:hypothetical protein